ncbi:ABC transporter permease [Croceimicrobium sp.]|uniref:ABC transporter permease n=1 Tax=Croceimicrobium sp. TaxID=2828340 RepID=UPI003BAD7617
MDRLLTNLNIALDAILANTLRSILTALGIIFGVAAVITMLAIGEGAQAEILRQIELVGVNNIEIKPIVEQKDEKIEEDLSAKEPKRFSKGLDLKDARSINRVLPTAAAVSPEIVIETSVISGGRRRSTKLIGVEPSFFPVSNIPLRYGQMFSPEHLEMQEPVCIIGSGMAKKLFPGKRPLGDKIKVGNQWLTIIGVSQTLNITTQAQENLGIRDYNMDIYAPITTVLSRYRDRAKLRESSGRFDDDEDEEKSSSSNNYHQLDRLLVQIDNSAYLASSADVISRLLKRTHNGMVDFEIIIPQQLLEQQQRTKDIFNLVLSAIAGISLLVGGIGIMNIMLASVLERTKEIGTRLAIGAKKKDIITQFLFEALLISLSGGIIGVILGVLASYVISEFADIETIVSPISIIISFGVASFTGLVFGLSPARQAAEKNPVESLRYE